MKTKSVIFLSYIILIVFFSSCMKKETKANNEEKEAIEVRHVPLKGAFNFRDLGGYKTQDGKHVKWRKIFRSDDLFNLTEEDLTYLSSIPLLSIVDFRSETEVEKAPDKIPSSLKDHYDYKISPGNLSMSSEMDLSFFATQGDSIMQAINKSLVVDSACVERYRDFFALLQDETKIPLLFHCTAGKDRTGMGAALILFALGVDEETIFEDYLLSNQYLEGKYGEIKKAHPEIASMLGVKREYLQAGIDEIRNRYGSIDSFLTEILNVDLIKFREIYLE